MIAAYRWTHSQVCWLGLRVDTESAFISWTEWTLAIAMLWGHDGIVLIIAMIQLIIALIMLHWRDYYRPIKERRRILEDNMTVVKDRVMFSEIKNIKVWHRSLNVTQSRHLLLLLFWNAPGPLGVRSARRRHQSPDWMILSHISCFIWGEVVGFQVLLDSLHPCSTWASRWSPPVLQRVKLLRSSWHLFRLVFTQYGWTGKDAVLGQ